MKHGYFVALFDVLGFEKRLKNFGLEEMCARYEALMEGVNALNRKMHYLFGELDFSEAPYWTNEKDISIFSKTYGAYASDSILLWANRTWPQACHVSDEIFHRSQDNLADGWKFHPMPCDNFLDACNEMMCQGLEVGLPLRGAIAIGDAVLDQARGIYLGEPIIEAARLESGHELIGASFCLSMKNQIIPARFSLPFEKHIKKNFRAQSSGAMLDWPRHWRRTRKYDLGAVITSLNTDPKYTKRYQNTLEMIDFSQTFSDKYESLEETSIRIQYEQFSWSNSELAVSARAIRRIPVDKESE